MRQSLEWHTACEFSVSLMTTVLSSDHSDHPTRLLLSAGTDSRLTHCTKKSREDVRGDILRGIGEAEIKKGHRNESGAAGKNVLSALLARGGDRERASKTNTLKGDQFAVCTTWRAGPSVDVPETRGEVSDGVVRARQPFDRIIEGVAGLAGEAGEWFA